jgi:L-threonylcarbamoyladenylate synthase
LSKRWKIGSEGPDPAQLEEIAALLKRGEVIVAPTDTIYGLHAVAANDPAVRKIFAIKGRSEEKPLPVLFSSVEQLEEAGAILSEEVRETLREIWPAPFTAVVPLLRPIPASAGAATVAARVPSVPWLLRLIERTGPLASTSANRSGLEPVSDPSSLPTELEREVGGLIDAGRVGGRPSTIVDFTGASPRVLRSGDFFFTQNLWKKSRKSL